MMSVIQSIEDKLNADETLKFVINEFVPELSKIFGNPSWLTRPKTGQSSDEIFEQYAKLLKPYRKEAALQRGREVFQYKDTRSFPTPSHLRVRLKPEDLKEEIHREKTIKGRSLEAEFMAANITSSLYVKCLHNDYTRAIKYIIDELLPERIGSNEYKKVRNDYSAKVELAQKNCLFTDFNSTLLMIYDRCHGTTEQRTNNGNFEF